ncbi:phosphatidic acid phosphatase type 2/haloperoxidase [Sphaerosporella brunnea]|uniref:Phosphatidic acid phosphatase type 2/haloperoxidase n=1 Tax=Sphaerosporella brunnea TaxID=1250544 RepID=A0A5J5EP59_9PEZI|nr:phosphatidic acid phosphatase type 2/haloperoxidase [Sphaerosporella brunnea]
MEMELQETTMITAHAESSPTQIENGPNKVDAGLLPRDHYKNRLPLWRYELRQLLLPLVRWETPYLAWMQEHCRTPFLDSYFALTANLGTHTFFMIMLPLMFWFGYTSLGRGVVHVLASGVFFSGFLKDLFCLPRPLSPPLHRITMSGSAALEYGFPSTHSTNAVSVALYGLLYLHSKPDIPINARIGTYILATVYTFSIIFGRLYCGMHGFLDVIVGIFLGAWLALMQWFLRDTFDHYVYGESFIPILIILVCIIVLVRIHPEPADACPCFDDGVAFAAVIGGVEIGNWHFAKTQWSWSEPVVGTVPYSFEQLGLAKTVARVVLGILVIFLWREVSKPFFHFILPPVYRFIGRIGLLLPRRHFTSASEYKKVPRLPDDTLPSLSEIPSLMRSVRGARSDSVGPQSAADAYETLAYREKRRRESQVSAAGPSNFDKYEQEMGTGYVDTSALIRGNHDLEALEEKSDNEEDEREVFKIIEPFKPRVRYDVEVVTKLVVYAGIAWWAVDGIPIIFELIGLGLGPQRQESR